MSEVRGSGRECQAATAQERPRRATQVRGQGRWPRGATQVRGQGWWPRGATQDQGQGRRPEELPHAPSRRPGAATGRNKPTPESRKGGQEDQPHVQGAVAPWAQEGLEELAHAEGQEGRQ